ncbi:MAG: hypothetical protein ACI8ZO_001336 [Flavobacteriales bacterium]|jgi:hypothetical protein
MQSITRRLNNIPFFISGFGLSIRVQEYRRGSYCAMLNFGAIKKQLQFEAAFKSNSV